MSQHHAPTHQSDPECDRLTGQGIASDKNFVDRAAGKMVGTGGSAGSSMLGQLPASAEIEEVRVLSCGALAPEFDAEEDAAREMYSQSDL